MIEKMGVLILYYKTWQQIVQKISYLNQFVGLILVIKHTRARQSYPNNNTIDINTLYIHWRSLEKLLQG